MTRVFHQFRPSLIAAWPRLPLCTKTTKHAPRRAAGAQYQRKCATNLMLPDWREPATERVSKLNVMTVLCCLGRWTKPTLSRWNPSRGKKRGRLERVGKPVIEILALPHQ